MQNSPRNRLQFNPQIYFLTSIIEEIVDEESGFFKLDWEESKVTRNIYKPTKVSILQHFIFSNICVYYQRNYRKNSDLIEESDINSLEKNFQQYEVEAISWHDFRKQHFSGIEFDEQMFFNWFNANEDAFYFLWGKYADEVFHLLFGNRGFLLKFNLALGKFIRSGKIDIPSKYLTSSGKVKRASYLPKWLKNAIYFRDNGRCVLCERDLSGLLSVDRRLHFDHTVPLNLGGSNDVTNFQLLCKSCNLSKSGSKIVTGNKYSTWWDYDDF